MRFRDRREAGKLLGEKLSFLQGRKDGVVLAVPRGGIVVGYEVAKALGFPLAAYITRKLGAPGNPELAIGAVASDGSILLEEDTVRQLGISSGYIEKETAHQREEIRRRLARYGQSQVDIKNKLAILVDDGVATGATILASIRAIRAQEPAELILAIPVGPPDAIAKLESEVDRLVVLSRPRLFWAVGEFYDTFDQTSDEEVVALLAQAGKDTGQEGREE